MLHIATAERAWEPRNFRVSCHDQVMSDSTSPSTSRTTGAQTLARGIDALKYIAARDGVSIVDVGDFLGVHRTVAYRLLNTLADASLVFRGADGKYRGSFGLSQLAVSAFSSLRAAALEPLQAASDALGVTVALIISEGAIARAVLVVSPRNGSYHVVFTEGSTHPLDRGAAGHAITALLPPTPADHPEVVLARTRGYAKTFGEVEPNMYGFALPLSLPDGGPAACLNVITTRADIEDDAVARLSSAAADIVARLA